MPLGRVLSLLSAQPAALLNLKGRGTLTVGSFADVVVFDPKAEWIYNARETKSKSRNTPFDGCSLQGPVRWTISEPGESLIHISRKDFDPRPEYRDPSTGLPTQRQMLYLCIIGAAMYTTSLRKVGGSVMLAVPPQPLKLKLLQLMAGGTASITDPPTLRRLVVYIAAPIIHKYNIWRCVGSPGAWIWIFRPWMKNPYAGCE